MAENSDSKVSIPQLILIPSVITLAITILRLVGELQQWPTVLFSREAGGGLALIGIWWLAFVFGIYFALKLWSAAEGPASVGRAIGYSLLGLVVFVGGAFLLFWGSNRGSRGTQALGWLVIAIGGLLPMLGWRRLGKVLLAYAFAARIPVLIIMYFSIRGDWPTHYSLGQPGVVYPDFWTKFVQIALLPQMILWIGYTTIIGSLVGTIVAAIVHRRKPAAEAAV
jgi:hypothetical protein